MYHTTRCHVANCTKIYKTYVLVQKLKRLDEKKMMGLKFILFKKKGYIYRQENTTKVSEPGALLNI